MSKPSIFQIEEGHSGQGGIEDQPKQFDRKHFLLIFTENFGFSGFFRLFFVFFGLFQFVTKQFCLFRLFRYRFETLKQTDLLFWVSRNKPKQTRNRFCFGLFRFEPKFIFVCFEDTLPGTKGGAHNRLRVRVPNSDDWRKA